MSCPSWSELVSERERCGGAVPQGWEQALAHLDGCAPCRRRAEGLDPLLAFRRLPAVTDSDAEVADMLRRVDVLRRARQVAGAAPAERRRWLGTAAAALLTAGLLLASHGSVPAPGEYGRAAAPVERASATLLSDLAELAVLPVLEHVDQPYEQVVQWSSDELSMILLLDERFDV